MNEAGEMKTINRFPIYKKPMRDKFVLLKIASIAILRIS